LSCWISGTVPRWSIQCMKTLHAGVDDGLGLRHGGLAVGLAGLHHAGQVVHGVEVDVFQRP
jgi:hypothetical protein